MIETGGLLKRIAESQEVELNKIEVNMNQINQFPEHACPNCKSDDWWFQQKEPWNETAFVSPEGEWLCGRCHPAPHPTTRLKYRVIKGNYKLNIVLQKIELMDGEEREKALVQYHAAYEKLKGLCNEMKAQGATECLYISNGKKMQRCLDDLKFTCTVCPNSYWWEKELLELDRNKYPEIWKDA